MIKYRIRFMCGQHGADLEAASDSNGNPEGPLFRVRPDESFGGSPSIADRKIAHQLGVIDLYTGKTLLAGVYYTFDTSNFWCPVAEAAAKHQDLWNTDCIETWTIQVTPVPKEPAQVVAWPYIETLLRELGKYDLYLADAFRLDMNRGNVDVSALRTLLLSMIRNRRQQHDGHPEHSGT